METSGATQQSFVRRDCPDRAHQNGYKTKPSPVMYCLHLVSLVHKTSNSRKLLFDKRNRLKPTTLS
jgi:hypothetical protein